MSAEGTQSLRNTLSSAWTNFATWCRELTSTALSPAVRRFLQSGLSVITIDIEETEVVLRRFADGDSSEVRRIPRAQFDAPTLAAALNPFLGRPWLIGDSFALRLPASYALRRVLVLPFGARSNVGNLLDFELDRQSPLDKSEVYHDYRVLGADRRAGRMDVEWRIVRRTSVAPALDICRRAGVDLAVIAFVGDTEPSDGGDLPVDPKASRAMRVKQGLVSGLLALILVLASLVTAGIYWRTQEAGEALSARVEQAQQTARLSLQLEGEIAAMQRHARALREEKQHLMASRVMAEVARILPDGTWATEFDLRGGAIHIHGYSGAASSLIALFDSSPLFSAAEFQAPLTQATTPGVQQFDLAAKIRDGAR